MTGVQTCALPIYNLHATEFCRLIKGKVKGLIFDPPYSPRQISECYKGIGKHLTQAEVQRWREDVKDIMTPKIKSGGIVICCGWNSQGFGKGLGFEMIEILTVAHGANHNDTIITVEIKK